MRPGIFEQVSQARMQPDEIIGEQRSAIVHERVMQVNQQAHDAIALLHLLRGEQLTPAFSDSTGAIVLRRDDENNPTIVGSVTIYYKPNHELSTQGSVPGYILYSANAEFGYISSMDPSSFDPVAPDLLRDFEHNYRLCTLPDGSRVVADFSGENTEETTLDMLRALPKPIGAMVDAPIFQHLDSMSQSIPIITEAADNPDLNPEITGLI